MAADAYQGHASWSSSKAAGENSDDVAPAERADYDPTAYASAPGAAARAGGWPRADGESNSSVK